jgi:hypothetical protein
VKGRGRCDDLRGSIRASKVPKLRGHLKKLQADQHFAPACFHGPCYPAGNLLTGLRVRQKDCLSRNYFHGEEQEASVRADVHRLSGFGEGFRPQPTINEDRQGGRNSA